MYCLCVNVYCTAATGCLPNCSKIYHIISLLARDALPLPDEGGTMRSRNVRNLTDQQTITLHETCTFSNTEVHSLHFNWMYPTIQNVRTQVSPMDGLWIEQQWADYCPVVAVGVKRPICTRGRTTQLSPDIFCPNGDVQSVCNYECTANTANVFETALPGRAELGLAATTPWRLQLRAVSVHIASYLFPEDRLCGLVVRVSGYRYRGLGFDSRRYHIFWVAVGLERGALSLVSLVRSIEELLE